MTIEEKPRVLTSRERRRRFGIAVLIVGAIVLLGGLSIAYRRALDPYAAADAKCQNLGSSRGETAYQRCVHDDLRGGPFGDGVVIWLTGASTACLVVGSICIAPRRRA